MSFVLPLLPELGERLIADAARLGIAPERLAAGLLEAHLPADRRAAALALLDSWHEGVDEVDQLEVGEALVLGLDAGRPRQRPHFPSELEGVTW